MASQSNKDSVRWLQDRSRDGRRSQGILNDSGMSWECGKRITRQTAWYNKKVAKLRAWLWKWLDRDNALHGGKELAEAEDEVLHDFFCYGHSCKGEADFFVVDWALPVSPRKSCSYLGRRSPKPGGGGGRENKGGVVMQHEVYDVVDRAVAETSETEARAFAGADLFQLRLSRQGGFGSRRDARSLYAVSSTVVDKVETTNGDICRFLFIKHYIFHSGESSTPQPDLYTCPTLLGRRSSRCVPQICNFSWIRAFTAGESCPRATRWYVFWRKWPRSVKSFSKAADAGSKGLDTRW